MCKHPMATIVNWYPISEKHTVDWQCDICGGRALNFDLEIDFELDELPTIDISYFPYVDVSAYETWNKRTSIIRPITSEKRAELIELMKESI